MEPDETPSNSASHQAPNYVQCSSNIAKHAETMKKNQFTITAPQPHRNHKFRQFNNMTGNYECVVTWPYCIGIILKKYKKMKSICCIIRLVNMYVISELQVLMGSLLYMKQGIHNSPYAFLLDPIYWDEICDVFTRDACALMGMSVESPLSVRYIPNSFTPK